MRRDAWLIIGAAAALAALIAVSWRATPDQADIAVILYLVGGVLELGGAATIAYDLLRRRDRRRTYDDAETSMHEREPQWDEVELEGASDDEVYLERKMWRSYVMYRLAILNWKVADPWHGRLMAYDPVRRRFPESDAAAWVGFVALLLGVLVGTVANIVSATA